MTLASIVYGCWFMGHEWCRHDNYKHCLECDKEIEL